MGTYIPRLPNAPLNYDYTNEAQFRQQVRQVLGDLASGFAVDITGLPSGSNGDLLFYVAATGKWTAGQTFFGTYDFTNAVQVRSQAGNPLTADREATLALIRSDDGGNEEFVDLYNNGYWSSGSKIATVYGLRIQKRGTGLYRNFWWDYYDGTTDTNGLFVQAPEGANDLEWSFYAGAKGATNLALYLTDTQVRAYSSVYVYPPTGENAIVFFYLNQSVNHAWIGVPSWDTDALYIAGPDAANTSNEIAWKYTQNAHYWYTVGSERMAMNATYLSLSGSLHLLTANQYGIYTNDSGGTARPVLRLWSDDWTYLDSGNGLYFRSAWGSTLLFALSTSGAQFSNIPAYFTTSDGYAGTMGEMGWSATTYITQNLYYAGSGSPDSATSWRYYGAAGASNTAGWLFRMASNSYGDVSLFYVPISTGASATPASLTQVLSISKSQMVLTTDADDMLRLNHGSSTGSPFISFAQNGTRRGWVQYNHSDSAMYLSNEYGPLYFQTGSAATEVTRMILLHTGYLHLLNSSNDEQLRIDHSSSTGSPYISFHQNGTRRGYLVYNNGGGMRLASEYYPISLAAGYSGTIAELMLLTAISSGHGTIYFADAGCYWENTDYTTGTKEIDYREGNMFTWDFTGAATFTLAATPPNGYICHIFMNYVSSSGAVTMSGFSVRWNGGTGPGTFGSSSTTLWITLLWQDGICLGDWGTYS